MQLAESTDGKLAQEVLKNITDQKCIHAGGLLQFINVIIPSIITRYEIKRAFFRFRCGL